MKRDMEHVITSTVLFLVAIVASSGVSTAAPRRRRRGPSGPSLMWFAGVALLVGGLVWTSTVYLGHVAFCAHLRLTVPPPLQPIGPPPTSPMVLDLAVLGVEAILLTAFVFFAIRIFRHRNRMFR